MNRLINRYITAVCLIALLCASLSCTKEDLEVKKQSIEQEDDETIAIAFSTMANAAGLEAQFKVAKDPKTKLMFYSNYYNTPDLGSVDAIISNLGYVPILWEYVYDYHDYTFADEVVRIWCNQVSSPDRKYTDYHANPIFRTTTEDYLEQTQGIYSFNARKYKPRKFYINRQDAADYVYSNFYSYEYVDQYLYELVEEPELKWGNAEVEHEFYALFPSPNIRGIADYDDSNRDPALKDPAWPFETKMDQNRVDLRIPAYIDYNINSNSEILLENMLDPKPYTLYYTDFTSNKDMIPSDSLYYHMNLFGGAKSKKTSKNVQIPMQPLFTTFCIDIVHNWEYLQIDSISLASATKAMNGNYTATLSFDNSKQNGYVINYNTSDWIQTPQNKKVTVRSTIGNPHMPISYYHSGYWIDSEANYSNNIRSLRLAPYSEIVKWDESRGEANKIENKFYRLFLLALPQDYQDLTITLYVSDLRNEKGLLMNPNIQNKTQKSLSLNLKKGGAWIKFEAGKYHRLIFASEDLPDIIKPGLTGTIEDPDYLYWTID